MKYLMMMATSAMLLMTSCATNRALYFDGVDDQVDLGNVFDDLTLPTTVSAWVWVDPKAPDGYLPIFITQVGPQDYYGLSLNTTRASSIGIQYGDGLGGNNSIYRRSKSAYLDPIVGKWVNITAIMRGAEDMDIYIDGVQVEGTYAGESDHTMNSVAPGGSARIGYHNMNGSVYHFKGRIDELRVWNRSLSSEEVRNVAFRKIDKSYPGLIGYWDFDEKAGEEVIDRSTNKFNGQLMGEPTRIKSDVPLRQ